MKILVAGYPYAPSLIDGIKEEIVSALSSAAIMEKNTANKNQVILNCVGYYYSQELNDCVFILPKVIVDESNNILGTYNPAELLEQGDTIIKNTDHRYFLQEFPVWIYRSIQAYKQRFNNNVLGRETYSSVNTSQSKVLPTLLDIILELFAFYRRNKDLCTFVVKNIHSGTDRIDWRKTINTQTAVLSKKGGKNQVIYMTPVNKKRTVDNDEELLIIFFSILNYALEKYGSFDGLPRIECRYGLIQGAQFEAYITSGMGKARLLRIKHKYFSDKLVQLWRLCYMFFDRMEANVTGKEYDYLLTYSYEHVFEKMIDVMIGDTKLANEKVLEDGKTIDHLYEGDSLFHPAKKIPHIADSKYYAIGAELPRDSIFKQHIYAKRIQNQIIHHTFASKGDTRYSVRDDLTEGYDIIPNFFISARIAPNMLADYDNPHLQMIDDEAANECQYHFKGRLFDRDTSWLTRFEINFLYVISSFAKGNETAWNTFRTKMRQEFRNKLMAKLNAHYTFSKRKFSSKNELKEEVDILFRKYTGMMFSYDTTLIIASENLS